jgi:hypothetical protein
MLSDEGFVTSRNMQLIKRTQFFFFNGYIMVFYVRKPEPSAALL